MEFILNSKIIESEKKEKNYIPLSRRQDRPNAAIWLIKNYPQLSDGQIAKLDEIVFLSEKYDAIIMVDDSHATGFIGNKE